MIWGLQHRVPCYWTLDSGSVLIPLLQPLERIGSQLAVKEVTVSFFFSH